MSTPNDAPDQNQPTPPNQPPSGGFVAPGSDGRSGNGGAPQYGASPSGAPQYGAPSGAPGYGSPSSGSPSYGTPPPGGQQYGGAPQYGNGPQYPGAPYGGQPGYGGQPPYGNPSGGDGGEPRSNIFGLIALIVGGVSLVLAIIPFVNYVSGVLSLVGIVLGIVGLVVKNRKRGLAIAGTIVSTLALILAIVLAITYTVGFATSVADDISSSIPEESSVPGAPGDDATPDPDERMVDVVYEVTGEGTDATIVYLSVSGSDVSDIETLTAQTLPWTQEFEATVGGQFDYSTFNVTASNGAADEGALSCSITVDGEVVAEDTADGAFGTVSCTSSGDID